MTNRTRQNEIIQTLIDEGPMSFGELDRWLGSPYCLEMNLRRMIAAKRLVEIEISRGGFNVTLVSVNNRPA